MTKLLKKASESKILKFKKKTRFVGNVIFLGEEETQNILNFLR